MITMRIIIFFNHEPEQNQCWQSKNHLHYLHSIAIPSVVTADSQHTEKLWESEFSGSLKHEVVL